MDGAGPATGIRTLAALGRARRAGASSRTTRHRQAAGFPTLQNGEDFRGTAAPDSRRQAFRRARRCGFERPQIRSRKACRRAVPARRSRAWSCRAAGAVGAWRFRRQGQGVPQAVSADRLAAWAWRCRNGIGEPHSFRGTTHKINQPQPGDSGRTARPSGKRASRWNALPRGVFGAKTKGAHCPLAVHPFFRLRSESGLGGGRKREGIAGEFL